MLWSVEYLGEAMTPAKPFRFEPGDFETVFGYHSEKADLAAFHANNVLDSHLATLPRAFGTQTQLDIVPKPTSSDEYTAIVWSVEPVEPKVCEHIGREVYKGRDPGNGDIRIYEWECTRCNAKLRPKWESAE